MLNRYQYNGIELNTDFSLLVNEARFRTLDPQLGRWWQIDPEVEQFEAWSAYNSNLDNPALKTNQHIKSTSAQTTAIATYTFS